MLSRFTSWIRRVNNLFEGRDRLRAITSPRHRTPLQVERLEERDVPAVDLLGYDARPLGYPDIYFKADPASPSWGSSFSVRFPIANTGNTPLSQSYNVAFYLSTNTVLDAPDQRIARFTGLTQPASAGQFWSYDATLWLPTSSPFPRGTAGPFYLLLHVDSDNLVAESNEANNHSQGAGKDTAVLNVLPPIVTVSDSVAPTTDRLVDFGPVVTDGPGHASQVRTVTITNTAAGSHLLLPQNGIRLAGGAHFRIESVLSNTRSAPVDPAAGSVLLLPRGEEILTVQVAFDPSATGALSDTLLIESDDPANPVVSVALRGTGTPVPNLVLADSRGEAADRLVDFGDVGMDGAGGRVASATVNVANSGSGPLAVAQNGIALPAGTPFTITGITSSTQGAINLDSGPKTLAPGGTETWAVSLRYDPTAVGSTQTPLTIRSNDPDEPSATVTLLGAAKLPPRLVINGGPVDFGDVVADGTGRQVATKTLTLRNTGELPLVVEQSGLTTPSGTPFGVVGIVSGTQGAVDVSSGPKALAPNGAESWTVTLQFDPGAVGTQSTTLRIASDGSATLGQPDAVALSGKGVDRPQLVVATDVPAEGSVPAFAATLNDGTGGRVTTRELRLTNVGTQPLVVSQNGIKVLTAGPFQVEGVTSSTAGPINLAAGAASLAAKGVETWTVRVRFDPTADGDASATLRVASNDPVRPTVDVPLRGRGERPQLTPRRPYVVNSGQDTVYVSAGRAVPVSWWPGAYSAGKATVSVWYDSDRDPANGMTLVTSGLDPESRQYYWQTPANLVGQRVHFYLGITDGAVTTGGYTDCSVTVSPVGTDRMLSSPLAVTPDYTLSIQVDGTTRNIPYTLTNEGSYYLRPTINGKAYEYEITRVTTLVDAEYHAYDESNNLTKTTFSNGQEVRYTINDLGQVTEARYPDNNWVKYSYDPAGNVTAMQWPSGWHLYDYDSRDRLVRVVESPDGSRMNPANRLTSYEFDPADRRTAMVYPSGKRVEYAFDAAGRVARVTEKNAGLADRVTTYEYDPATGQPTRVVRPNGTTTSYTFDEHGRLYEITHRDAGGQLLVAYTYPQDFAGRRTQVVVRTPQGVRNEAYGYDDLGRLGEVTYSDNNGVIEPTDYTVRYRYDKNGNRTQVITLANGFANPPTATLTYAYTFENRLESITDQNGVVQARFFYDARGNRIRKVTPTETVEYRYDARNLLLSVNNGRDHVAYEYDGAGRRIAQVVNGSRTRFVNDIAGEIYQPIEEYLGTATQPTTHVYGAERLYTDEGGAGRQQHYMNDGLGSVGLLTDAAGRLGSAYRNDVFGAKLSGGSSVPFAFTGERYEDRTGLVYLRNRDYDPAVGQFLQKDPVKTSNLNSRYIYTESDPVNKLDPLGTSSIGYDWLFDYFDPEEVIGAVNGFNGFADVLSIGATSWLRDYAFGSADRVDTTSTAYLAGEYAGIGTSLALGGAGLVSGLGRLGQVTQASARGGILIGEGSVPWFRNLVSGLGLPGAERVARTGSLLGLKTFSSSATTFGGLLLDNYQWFKGALESGKSVVSIGRNPLRFTPGEFFALESQWGALAGASVINGNFAGQLGAGAYFSAAAGSGLADKLGGVLIDKAAQFLGANLRDFRGATFDPVTRQLIFLGSESPSQVRDVNLDLFITAVQSVYGAVAPPSVTLDPPANLLETDFNIGAGDGVLPNGRSVALPVHYTPYATTDLDDMTLTFRANGQLVTVRIDAQKWGIYAGSRQAVLLGLQSVAGSPAGLVVTMPALGSFSGGMSLKLTEQGQDSVFYVTVTNNTGAALTITGLTLKPDLQHRKFSGRVDGTTLGWIQLEADRVVKNLALGKDALSGAIYGASNGNLPAGFRSMLERYAAANDFGGHDTRMWLTPNEMTLKRSFDPATGQATILFDRSTVRLNTESLLAGRPEDPIARAFVDHFNANYDAFAALDFPVRDPSDPAGQRVINVKIFDRLREAMKAVSLARFFKDNAIPLDTWWINSWEAPKAYVVETIPTLTNSMTVSGGTATLTMWGGVSIDRLNSYIPDPVAQSIGNMVRSQRPADPNQPTDVGAQAWTVSTGAAAGTLRAAAASFDEQKQDANVTLAEVDLAIPSPGGRQLAFDRYYNSGYLRDQGLGRGWRATPSELQFENESLVDDYGLMRTASGGRVPVYGARSDTRLRPGEVRFVDHATGQLLNFQSSLRWAYALDANNNPVVQASGLGDNGLPTFAPGAYRDGSRLTMQPNGAYRLDRPDGSWFGFTDKGQLLRSVDRLGNAIDYEYSAPAGVAVIDAALRLEAVKDSAGQRIQLAYVGDRVQSATALNASGTPLRRVAFSYDAAGRLEKAETQKPTGNGGFAAVRATRYESGADGRLSGVVGTDGVRQLTSASDLRGRSTQRQDSLGNRDGFAFGVDPASLVRTTTVTDLGTAGANNATAHGLDALRYFGAGSAASRQTDAADRLLRSTNALGQATQFGYAGGSLAPTSVTLPRPGRPAVSITRDANNLPREVWDPANAGGQPVKVNYNAANLPAEVVDSKGRVTRVTYTAWNDVATVTEAAGTPQERVTTYSYNAQKLLERVSRALSATASLVLVEYGYDSLGRVTSVKDGAGVTARYSYDDLGRLSRVYDPRLRGAQNYVEYVYNDDDQVVRVVTPTATATNEYDPATKRLAATTALTGLRTAYGYSPEGLLTATTQVSGSLGNLVTRFEYDRRGALALIITPEGQRTAFRSDALGQPTALVEDEAGRLAAVRVTKTVVAADAMAVNVTAADPVLVASLKYWQDGQAESTAATATLRVEDKFKFAFNLTGVDAAKRYRYKLTLTDSAGQTRELPEGVLNTAPVTGVTLSTASPKTNDVLTATATKSDAENDPVSLTFNWWVNGVFRRSFTSATALTDSLDLGQNGNGNKGEEILVEVRANDGLITTFAKARSTVVNTAPMAAIGGAPPTSPEGTAVNLTAAATDPDPAETLTYAWSVTKNGSAFGSGSGSGWSFTPDDEGTYVVNLTVTDGSGATGAASKTVTVTNVAPAVSAGGDAGFAAGGTLSRTGTFTDPGADSWAGTVNYGDGSGDQPLTIDAARRSFSLSRSYPNPGTYTVTVKVRDADGGEGLASFTVRAVAPPNVQGVQVNDGSAQRSMVTSLTVTFSSRVQLPANPAEAFALTGPGGAVAVAVDLSRSTTTQTVAVLTFAGSGIVGGSLADGNYTLRVIASRVADAAVASVRMAVDRTFSVYRFFGDLTGDRSVTNADMSIFNKAFGSRRGQTNYNPACDFDGDGDVDAADWQQFTARMGKSLPPG